jgi:glycosyltransferase involved in cell wall biosynthesis
MYRSACKAWHYTSVNERRDSWPFEHVAGFVAPNGIDVEQYAIDRDGAYEAVVSEWPECAGYRYVLFLGRLHAKKRLDLLLEAFLEAAPNTHKLVIAGPDEGGLWNDLAKRFLTRPEHRQRVIRVGLVTGAKKSRLLAGASLFALASEHENFGNAVLESLAAGTPVLGSSHVDLVTELASEGLAEVADLNLAAWKDQLSSLLPRPPSEEFVQTARHWIAEHYGWDHVAKLIAREYESLT